MLLMYRMPRTLEMNRIRHVFTTRSTVIALPGTWKRLILPSHLIVRPALEIPYSARPASAVEVDIDSSSDRIRKMRKTSVAPLPTSESKAVTYVELDAIAALDGTPV